jgi:prophage regulatory protein
MGQQIMKIPIRPAYLDKDTVAAYIGIAKSTLEGLVQRGAFPAPRQITDKRVGWLVREVDEWAESRPVSSNLPVANCGRNQ